MPTEQPRWSFKPRRELGRTGFLATILGIGDLADRNVPLEECVRTARRAMDAGLNLIDTAPGYESGYSEQIVGQALNGRRDGVFVIDKIDHHDKPVAAQVDESLARMQLDCADLFVFHAVSTLPGWRKLASPGGGMDALAECIRAGKARFRGISSHSPGILQDAIVSGLCDVILFPVGPFCDRRFVEEVLPLARRQGVGTVCFKTFGAGKLLGDTIGYNRPLVERPRGKLSSGGSDSAEPTLPHMSVPECVHYTLSCDPDVALLGLSFPNEQDPAFDAAMSFQALPSGRLKEIAARAAVAMEGKGAAWWNPA